jgi:hypothetical protein
MTTKKYLPLIALIAAALLLFYVKNKQRGHIAANDNTVITIPAVTNEEAINRKPTSIIYSRHARCRMECRHIDETEVKEILENGEINSSKKQQDGRGKTYPLEGVTHDKQHVRIVFALTKDNAVEVVTCIDLDTEWPCDCK